MNKAYWKILLCDEYINEKPDENGKFPWQFDRKIMKAGLLDVAAHVETESDLCEVILDYTGFFGFSKWEKREDNDKVFFMKGDSANAENYWEWMELECGFVQSNTEDRQPDTETPEENVFTRYEKLLEALNEYKPYELAQCFMDVGGITNVSLNMIKLGVDTEDSMEESKSKLSELLYKLQEHVNNMVYIIEDA